MAFESADQGLSVTPAVAECTGRRRARRPLLGWTSRDRDGALDAYDAGVRRVFGSHR